MANNFLDKTGLSYFWQKIKTHVSSQLEVKQDKISGIKGQLVGFDDQGNAVAQDSGFPEGGSDGQVLTKTVDGKNWTYPNNIKILEAVVENIELTDDAPSYTLPEEITLALYTTGDLYMLKYQLYDADGTEVADWNGFYIGGAIDYSDIGFCVQFFSNGTSTSVNLRPTVLNDNNRDTGQKSIVSIYKIRTYANNRQNTLLPYLEGKNNISGGRFAHAEGWLTRAMGECSHTEGYNTRATGLDAHAEGGVTTASGRYSHAEGYNTKASGYYSHAEGTGTTASGDCSHAGGSGAIASGDGSFAHGSTIYYSEGSNPSIEYDTKAEGRNSVAFGIGAQAIGKSSIALGELTLASGDCSHAEGRLTTASGNRSHAEGYGTTASGNLSHAEGDETTASGYASHAGGYGTIATSPCQMAIGKYNVEMAFDPIISSRPDPDAYFIVGCGDLPDERANAFRIGETSVWGGTYNSSGADYAEYFEWLDGNTEQEDRVGRFVTLDGEKIRFASSDDAYILGIISGAPSIVGDSHDDQWSKMYLTDVYGRLIYETVSVEQEIETPDGKSTITDTITRRKLNPDYDSSQTYIPRSKRSEWAAVGMLGKLVALDDGTCEVNGYCSVGINGIGTKSDIPTPYRVIARLDETHIRLLIH